MMILMNYWIECWTNWISILMIMKIQMIDWMRRLNLIGRKKLYFLKKNLRWTLVFHHRRSLRHLPSLRRGSH